MLQHTHNFELYNQANTSMIKHWASFSPYGIQNSSELNTKKRGFFSP